MMIGGHMDRAFTSTDLLTFAGMMATVVGIFLCLFFLFAPVTFGATPADTLINRSPDLQLSMRWIQPILGQEIVEDALIKQQYKSEIVEVARIRNRTQLQTPDPAESLNIDHAALIQWVIGRLIVELTRHRMESGLPAADRPRDETKQRIMTIAQQAEQEFDKILRTEWQTKLGREIVTEPVRRARTIERNPDEPGLIF
jgi:DNA-binding transcriptional regulator YiaG